jgi:TPR repeat protein
VSVLLASSYHVQAQTAPVGIDSKVWAAANAGDVDSQMHVASAYAKGNGVQQDYTLAANWLRKAADEGKVRADYFLGVYYHRGLGVPQDDAQAALWYRKGADRGDLDAEYALGLHYENGTGVKKDFAQAADWYRKAAGQGNAEAQLHLAQLYENGEGVPRDEEIAAEWFGQAASHGNLYAETQLDWLKREQKSRIDLHRQIVSVAIWIAVALCVFVVLYRLKTELAIISKKLKPKSTRQKQFAVLLLAATWCSGCCVYQFLTMWHPVEAAVKALLLCTPALIFGAACFWWFSQNATRESDRSDQH